MNTAWSSFRVETGLPIAGLLRLSAKVRARSNRSAWTGRFSCRPTMHWHSKAMERASQATTTCSRMCREAAAVFEAEAVALNGAGAALLLAFGFNPNTAMPTSAFPRPLAAAGDGGVAGAGQGSAHGPDTEDLASPLKQDFVIVAQLLRSPNFEVGGTKIPLSNEHQTLKRSLDTLNPKPFSALSGFHVNAWMSNSCALSLALKVLSALALRACCAKPGPYP